MSHVSPGINSKSLITEIAIIYVTKDGMTMVLHAQKAVIMEELPDLYLMEIALVQELQY
jgi:hypothetical protein